MTYTPNKIDESIDRTTNTESAEISAGKLFQKGSWANISHPFAIVTRSSTAANASDFVVELQCAPAPEFNIDWGVCERFTMEENGKPILIRLSIGLRYRFKYISGGVANETYRVVFAT